MQHLTLSDAKTRLRIPDLWRLYGFPNEPRKSCHCPFHDDRSASFSISPDGLLWHCFAGCGGGDAVDFLRQALVLSQGEACREFLRLAGGVSHSALGVNRREPIRPTTTVNISQVTPGTETDWRTLATLRNVSINTVAQISERGLLHFGTHQQQAAWIVIDASRRNAQARRMDGQPWEEIGHKKAWTLRGSQAAWPIGTTEAKEFSCIAFCEGGPDLLAAFHFIHCEGRDADCSAVTMLGASLSIHAEAVPRFAGKRIRIFGHADANVAGKRAVERWAEQLTQVGANVDAFDFTGLRKVDGSPVKDLNDCVSVCADDFEANRELWNAMP